jgi:membrane peptidoglycan carboxypeptidase
MNSYGDPQSARARARVPGPSTAPAPDDDQLEYDQLRQPPPDAYRRGSAGRATVTGSGPRGAAPVGNTTGRASVGVSNGRVAEAYGNGGYGGRASARAAVTPVSPAVGGGGNGTGHGTRGSAGKILSKAAKRRRRTNILTAAAAVVVILLGGGVVAGTWFFDGVDLPQPKSEDQSNTLLDGNGHVIAKLGSQNRTVVPQASISQMVEHAVAAAEDRNFYTHNGIDMKGIMRAAWNNFTGGSTQGASTITQQYARHAAELKDISYNRKLREAVIARKLESTYDKSEIMGFYLNSIYLGEGRYGIEAAALGYFGKSVTAPPGSKDALTISEAAVLASIIKQPEPIPGGHQGYDPNFNLPAAKERWQYTLNNMLQMKWISQEEHDTAVYPLKTLRKPDSGQCGSTCLDDKPVGMIKRHVQQELREMGITDDQQRRGGLTITTTIDPQIQDLAVAYASRSSATSPMHSKPKTYQAALIAIDPNTGRVLGYYGGDDPNGLDYAGYMNGSGEITGGQSPGSTFKIYTLSAGLKDNLSFDSHWNGNLPRIGGGKISNAGADPNTVCGGQIQFCQLEKATVQSFNFPFYWIANKVGPPNVVQAAKDAGLGHLWTDSLASLGGKSKLVDLSKTDQATWKKYFAEEVGFGQYRVVPLEHANGVATIVNQGVYHKAHFVESVTQREDLTGKVLPVGKESLTGKRVFPADQMSNLTGVMEKIPDHAGNVLRNGRPAAAKTGTWEFDQTKGGSGDAWMVGGIPQMAVTVWVGGKDKRVALKDGNGDMFGAGTPAAIWQEFIDAVTKKLNWDVKQFPARTPTGDPNALGNGEAPPVQPQGQDCLLGFICPGGNNNGGTDNGNTDNGNTDNGNTNNGGTNNGGQVVPLPGTTNVPGNGNNAGAGGGQQIDGG